MTITTKFGGDAMKNTANQLQALEIICSDLDRTRNILSAAGADDSITEFNFRDTEILQFMAQFYREAGQFPKREFNLLQNKHRNICSGHGIDCDLVVGPVFDRLEKAITNWKIGWNPLRHLDSIQALGEYFTAREMAASARHNFNIKGRAITADILALPAYGEFCQGKVDFSNTRQTKQTQNLLNIYHDSTLFITGYAGITTSNDLITLGRSSSETVAVAIEHLIGEENTVEIWRAISGMMTADPRVVNSAKPVKCATLAEARELSYSGMEALCQGAVLLAGKYGVNLHLKDTRNPNAPGTMLSRERENKNGPVTAIAHKCGYTMLSVEGLYIDDQKGLVEEASNICAKNDVPIAYPISLRDNLTLIIESKYLSPKGNEGLRNKILGEFENIYGINFNYVDNRAILAVVGHSRESEIGVLRRTAGAIERAGQNIEFHTGIGPITIYALEERNIEDAVRAVHSEFFE
jgi:aspartate kinase